MTFTDKQQADRIEGMLKYLVSEIRKVSSPASTMGLQGKAEAIRKALQSGDKKFIRQTMKEISDNN